MGVDGRSGPRRSGESSEESANRIRFLESKLERRTGVASEGLAGELVMVEEWPPRGEVAALKKGAVSGLAEPLKSLRRAGEFWRMGEGLSSRDALSKLPWWLLSWWGDGIAPRLWKKTGA